MMRPLLLVVAVLYTTDSFGQWTYGNEWIDHDRQYWRFDVWQDGVLRIDSATLAASGFPISSVDPRDLMLFAREKEVPIYVRGEADGVFNATDFIEFQTRKNDGWIDQRMYALPEHDPNPYYSFYNDTIHYFLTWDESAPVQHIHDYVNTDIASFIARPWVYSEAKTVFSDYYWMGYVEPNWLQQGSYITSGMMQESEGWGGLFLRYDLGIVNQDVLVQTPRPYVGVDAPDAEVTATSAAQDAPGNGWADDHHLQLKYGAGFNNIGVDTIFRGARTVRGNFSVPASELAGSTLMIRYHSPHDLTGPNQVGSWNPNYWDWQVISNVKVRYARTTHLDWTAGPLVFGIPDDAGDPLARLTISNFTGTPVIYAWGDTVRRIEAIQGVGVWDALVPADPASDETQSFLFASESIGSVSVLRPVNGTGYFTDFMTLEADSAMLIIAHKSLMNGALAYEHYREAETDYNPYDAVVADIDELYDQFGGGVPKHAMGIRGWCKYLLDNWATAPRALFLIGKSVNTWPVYGGQSDAIRPPVPGAYERCLIPSFGYPSCDQCLTTGLNFDHRRMDIPVGRLSANTDQDVLDYLDKVRDLEAQDPGDWMKNVLHFAGGFSQGEVNAKAATLYSMGTLATGTYFGADTANFKKVTSDIISTLPPADAERVRHLIEDKGVTLLTFLAHAYSQDFDITIDQPQNYNWHGKHPMVIAMSCYIGNIHGNGLPGASEEWVDLPAAGPVAFMASTEQGIENFLVTYTSRFYESMSQLNHGGSIGEHMQYAGFSTQQQSGQPETVYTVHTFTLQGDPTLTLNAQPLPDYAVSAPEIFFEPATITADVDSFTVKVLVSNWGRAVDSTFTVELQRTNVSQPGVMQPYFATMSNVHLRDTAYFRVPTLGFNGWQGVNQLSVRVDLVPDQVDELDDAYNNVTTTTVFITSGDLVPIYPYDFAIVPEPTPMLKASTGDPLAPPRNYVFQIDTTDLFNSPILETTMINAPGGVVSWQPAAIYALNLVEDSTVFFWRCSIDSVGNNNQYNWYERSFQYITGKHGWGQAHYFQFKNDDYTGVTYDRPERDFDFFEGQVNLRAEVLYNVGNHLTNWALDLAPQDYGGCEPGPAWHVAIIDPVTFVPWGTYGEENGVMLNEDHQFGNGNNGPACRTRVEYNFNFNTSVPGEMVALQNMIEDTVPDGYHMLFLTWRYLDKDGSGPGVLTAMENLAPSDLDFNAIPDSVPYIFYVRKGYPETFADTVGIADPDTTTLFFSTWIESAQDQGFITTMNSSYATAWHGLYWNELHSSPDDSTVISVQGIPAGGTTPVGLGIELPSLQDSLPLLGTMVNAAQYPQLRIRGYFSDLDAQDPKPAQMVRWQLLGSPAPECAIHPPLGYFNTLESLSEGNDAAVAVAVENISEFDMDSLLITASIIKANNQRDTIHYKVNGPLPSGAFVMDTVRFNTLGYGGLNTLIIEANGVDTATGIYHQLEQYHFNNIAQWRFDVDTDEENPLLDITFDGMHILDGDIVSAKPEIVITLDDENPLLLLDSPADTSLFKVFLQRPDGSELERLRFMDGTGFGTLQFVPADGADNVARINYHPVFAADGKYLLTVQATDLSENYSGDYDYRITFEVINRSTITEVLNYPNPFTTSTRFVFTLTGSEPPTYMKVQIMTVTGKVVREVSTAELGPIRVGRNITEFAWDGTDQFGDRLARGVYLYRVIAQINGEDIESRETSASQYFTKGFGKMYLLR